MELSGAYGRLSKVLRRLCPVIDYSERVERVERVETIYMDIVGDGGDLSLETLK